MPKFNDIDLKEWKNCDINTDSLWLIKERDKRDLLARNFKRG